MSEADSKNDPQKKKTSGVNQIAMVSAVEQQAKEDRRIKLWHMRTAFLRRGFQSMKAKKFSDAATYYEKYIRIIEMTFDVPKGSLEPDLFKTSARTSELSVITSVYWDLARVYDSSEHHRERQERAIQKLMIFAHLTPIYNELVRQAEIFKKNCKRPDLINTFLTGASKHSRCFIATSAFESPTAFEVMQLRHFRDQRLRQSMLGRKFILLYYRYSPTMACFLDKHAFLKSPVRWALRGVIKCVS